MGVSGGCDSSCKVVMGYICTVNSTGYSNCAFNTHIKVLEKDVIVSTAKCNRITFTFTLKGLD